MTKLVSIALVGLISMVLAPPLHSQTNDLRDTFANAYALYSNGSPAQAKGLFQKTTDAKFRLADYSLYYLAMIAFNESKWDESRQFLAQLRQRYPHSVWSAPAKLQRAKIDIAEQKFSQAIEALRRLQRRVGPPSVISSTKRFICKGRLKKRSAIKAWPTPCIKNCVTHRPIHAGRHRRAKTKLGCARSIPISFPSKLFNLLPRKPTAWFASGRAMTRKSSIENF